MIKGACLCRRIEFEIAEVGRISYCHCKMCQKTHGAAFGPYGFVREEDFKLLSGQQEIRQYRSSEAVTRTFCANCGSTLQFIRDNRAGFGIALGVLDDDPVQRVSVQMFCEFKAGWFQLDERIQQMNSG